MSNPPLRILITGKNGQLGWDLAQCYRALFQANPAIAGEVIALDRATLDLTHPEQIRAKVRELRPQLIINAAGYTHVDQAEQEPHLALQVNAVAPGILAEEANRCGAALIHYSTDYVFAGDACTPYREEELTQPQNIYGQSKLLGEKAIAAIAQRYAIIRCSWLYSNRRHNFLHTILRLARERDTLRIVDDQQGSPTWVRTVTDVTQRMAPLTPGGIALTVPNGIYHVAARGVTSWHGFAKAIIDHTTDPERRAHQVEAISSADYAAAARLTTAKRPAYSVLSHDKVEQTLGITLDDWQTQLQACLAERAAIGAERPTPVISAGNEAIQLFVPTFRIDECLGAIRECLEKGWTGLGYKTLAFEEAWKTYTGLPYAHFLNSATAGLHL
ncbi:MAG: dTDP-4-dehydrorhamnose reductase, partial [Betaproteobacteria bacterium]|nr:dTDP-4-dehydrorhamnose reductase [Betaproteobacteria bacterium]